MGYLDNAGLAYLWGKVRTAVAGKADKAHTHAWEAVTGKPSSFPPTAHASTHKTGGTDALTPKDIGACAAPARVVVTLPIDGWALAGGCYAQTVSCPGLLASDDQSTVRVEPVGSTDYAAQKLTDAAYACINYVACTTNGQLYVRCGDKKPTVAFQAAVCMAR